MNALTRACFSFAIRQSLRKSKGLGMVPRSGAEGEAVDETITQCTAEDGQEYLLLKREGDTLQAVGWDGTRFNKPTELEMAQLVPASLQIEHFYGLETVKCNGPYESAWTFATRFPYARIQLRRLINSVAQAIFNRRSLQSQRRSAILAEIVELAEAGKEQVHAWDIMSKRFGHRWIHHPQKERLKAQIRFHLERLAESGEVRAVGIGFLPTGAAMKALEESEEQASRHAESMRLQILLALLALLAAIMAAAQANVVRLPTMLDFTSDKGAGSPICTASWQD